MKSVIGAANRLGFGVREAVVFAYNLPPIIGLGTGSGFEYQLVDREGRSPAELAATAQGLVVAANQDPRLAQVFTTYAAKGFSLDDQALLARLARHTVQERQVPVLISNHATALTYELYRGAALDEIQVKRTISRSAGNRNKVGELLALYLPGMDFDKP